MNNLYIFLLTIVAIFFSSGCSKYTKLHYDPFVKYLDENNEISISTYPAGHARKTFHIPFVYESLVSPEEVFFQVHVRDSTKKVGMNSHVNTIRIHSFSIKAANKREIQLISNYEHSFWMQGRPKHNVSEIVPVAYDSKVPLKIEIALTLNNTDYAFEGELNPRQSVSMRPLFSNLLR